MTSPSTRGTKRKPIVLAAFDKFEPEMRTLGEEFFDEKRIHAPVLPAETRRGHSRRRTVASANPFVFMNFLAANAM